MLSRNLNGADRSEWSPTVVVRNCRTADSLRKAVGLRTGQGGVIGTISAGADRPIGVRW